MGASQWKKHGNKYGYWKYFVEKERLASIPPPAKSLASVKTPNQHEQREQTIRKSIESILFANGVKCDEEQFLIEDIEHLLDKEREESFIKGIMAEDDVRDKIRLEMFIKEKTK